MATAAFTPAMSGLDFSGSMGGSGPAPSAQLSGNYNQAASAGQVYGPVNPASGYRQSSGGSVLGTSTYQAPASAPAPSGGGAKYVPPPGQPGGGDAGARAAGYPDYSAYQLALSQAAGAAGQVSQAQIQQATDMYNNLKAQIDAQKGGIQSAYNTGVSNLDTAYGQQQSAAGTQKQELQTNTDNATNTAYQNYLALQAQNRAIARSSGGMSSAYLENQNQAGRQYSNTTTGINTDLASRVNDINQNLTAASNYYQAQKAQLGSQLNQSMQQIALNENATDFQKADAIQQIQADYANKIAAINSSITQFQQQFALAQQQVAMYAQLYGKSASGYNPYQYGLAGGVPQAQQANAVPQSPGMSGIDLSKLYGSTIPNQPSATGGF